VGATPAPTPAKARDYVSEPDGTDGANRMMDNEVKKRKRIQNDVTKDPNGGNDDTMEDDFARQKKVEGQIQSICARISAPRVRGQDDPTVSNLLPAHLDESCRKCAALAAPNYSLLAREEVHTHDDIPFCHCREQDDLTVPERQPTGERGPSYDEPPKVPSVKDGVDLANKQQMAEDDKRDRKAKRNPSEVGMTVDCDDANEDDDVDINGCDKTMISR